MISQEDRKKLFHDRAESDRWRLVDEYIDSLDDADMLDLLGQCAESFGYIKIIVACTGRGINLSSTDALISVAAPAVRFVDCLRRYVDRVYGDDLVEKYAEALADEDAKARVGR